jgi:hypothetical protein
MSQAVGEHCQRPNAMGISPQARGGLFMVLYGPLIRVEQAWKWGIQPNKIIVKPNKIIVKPMFGLENTTRFGDDLLRNWPSDVWLALEEGKD